MPLCVRLEVFPVVGQVEGLHAPPAQHPVGELAGDAEAAFDRGRSRRRLVGLRPAARHEDAASQAVSAGQAIDPAHGHGPRLGGLFQTGHHGVQTVDPPALAPNPRRGDAAHGELHFEDVAGQSHAADGRAEKLALVLVGTFQHPPVRHAELEAPHVLAKAAVDVMILAVDVGSDHAAQGDELRARRDGHEPAAAQQQAIQGQQRQAGLAPQHAGLLVEGQQPVGRRRVGHGEAGRGRQRRVSVGTAQPAAERRLCGNLFELLRLAVRRLRRRGISPNRRAASSCWRWTLESILVRKSGRFRPGEVAQWSAAVGAGGTAVLRNAAACASTRAQ